MINYKQTPVQQSITSSTSDKVKDESQKTVQDRITILRDRNILIKNR